MQPRDATQNTAKSNAINDLSQGRQAQSSTLPHQTPFNAHRRMRGEWNLHVGASPTCTCPSPEDHQRLLKCADAEWHKFRFEQYSDLAAGNKLGRDS